MQTEGPYSTKSLQFGLVLQTYAIVSFNSLAYKVHSQKLTIKECILTGRIAVGDVKFNFPYAFYSLMINFS